MSVQNRWPAWTMLLPLFLMIAVLGVHGANQDAIWYDEWWTIRYAGAESGDNPIPLEVTLERIAETYHELNPPGYYLVINTWNRLAGTEPFALRLTALFFAFLAVAFVYRTGTMMHSAQAGLGAAWLLGASAFFLQYSHELRAYMMMVCLVAILLCCFVRIMSPRFTDVPRLVYAGFLLSGAALLLTHYMAIPFLAALALYHLLIAPKDRRWWVVIGLALLAIVGLLLWLPVGLGAFRQASQDPARDFFSRSLPELVERLLARFGAGSALLVLVIGFYAIGRARLWWFLLLAGLLITGIINAAFSFVTDVHYLIAFLPPLALLLGIGYAHAPGRRVLLAIWVLSGVGATIFPASPGPDAWRLYLPWRDVRAQLVSVASRGDTLLFALPYPDPNWIHQPVGDYYLSDLGVNVRLLESLPDTTPSQLDANLAELTDELRSFWVAWDADQPPSVFAQIALSHKLIDELQCPFEQQTDRNSLTLYTTLPSEPLPNQFGDIGVGLLEPLNSENPARLLIGTTAAPGTPLDTFSVGVYFFNEAGELAANADYGLQADTTCRLVRIPPLEPGHYAVETAVYRWQDGMRLEGVNIASGISGDLLPLGTLTISP